MNRPLHILIVDDSPEDREVYKRLLRKCVLELGEIEVTEAATAEEGLSLLRSASPDCVMLDYRLPDATGLEFLSSAAALLGDAVLQVVMLTGQGSESVAVEAMKRGAADYLSKDELSVDSLRRAVQNAVEREMLHQRLQRAEAEHREFAHTAAHDLKAPLRQVRQYSQLLTLKCGKNLDDEGRMFVDRIRTTADRMSQIVADLLTYASVTAEGANPEIVELDSVAADVLTLLDGTIAELGATIELDPLHAIWGHRALLARLLQNLVGNALKFAGEHPPHIVIRTRRMDDDVVLTVADNGIGIVEADAASIFKPFKRLHARSKFEGSGIGLATCQRVAAVHQGRIWVESEVGRGSEFHVAFPVHGAEEDSIVERPGRPRLLIVDDDPDELALASLYLGDAFVVTTAGSPDDALEFLEREPVEAVLSDFRMPTHDGLWLLRRVKERHPEVARVLTSSSRPPDVEARLAEGVIHQFFPKIVDAATLMTTVCEAVA